MPEREFEPFVILNFMDSIYSKQNLYKIVIRNCPNWREHKTCLIGISMGVDYFDGLKFQSLLCWVNDNFKKCIILIADTAHRHNLMAEHLYSEDKALIEAKKVSSLWFKRNAQIINDLTIESKIFHWDDWLMREDVQNLIPKFHEAYNKDLFYQASVDEDAQRFLDRKRSRKEHIRDENYMLQKSVDYLLEESAIDTVMAPLYPAVDAYPGSELNCQKIVRQGKVAMLPDSMKFFAKAQVQFKQSSS